ncbi:MAG: response regulator [Planctomycetes bacterium]|nr:response regulator [Planctomycetota bacterium]
MVSQGELIDTQSAAGFLGLHEETLRRFAREGKVPSYKAGRSWRFDREELRCWAREQSMVMLQREILVVDDDPDIRGFLTELLEDAGYRVVCARTAREAVEVLERETPDAIILDLKLPDMPGPKVMEEADRLDKNLPVVIHTGYPDSELMAKALEHSPVTVVSKPASKKQLLRAVKTALGNGE